MTLHKEVSFEVEICEHLAAHGWLHAAGDASTYDRARALFPADVLAWVQTTQPQAWQALTKNHGTQAETTLLSRLLLRCMPGDTARRTQNGTCVSARTPPAAVARWWRSSGRALVDVVRVVAPASADARRADGARCSRAPERKRGGAASRQRGSSRCSQR